jgi:hypothetical protein
VERLGTEADALTAQLTLVAVAYCVDDASGDDWGLVFAAADRSLGALAVEAEEAVEGLATAVISAASELSKAELSAVEAVAVLARLDNVGPAVEARAAEALASNPLRSAAAGGPKGAAAYAELLLIVLGTADRFGDSLPRPKVRPFHHRRTLNLSLRLESTEDRNFTSFRRSYNITRRFELLN